MVGNHIKKFSNQGGLFNSSPPNLTSHLGSLLNNKPILHRPFDYNSLFMERIKVRLLQGQAFMISSKREKPHINDVIEGMIYYVTLMHKFFVILVPLGMGTGMDEDSF